MVELYEGDEYCGTTVGDQTDGYGDNLPVSALSILVPSQVLSSRVRASPSLTKPHILPESLCALDQLPDTLRHLTSLSFARCPGIPKHC